MAAIQPGACFWGGTRCPGNDRRLGREADPHRQGGIGRSRKAVAGQYRIDPVMVREPDKLQSHGCGICKSKHSVEMRLQLRRIPVRVLPDH